MSSSRQSGGCCRGCCSFIITVGTAFLVSYVFFVIFSFKPRFYLSDFHTPPISSANSAAAAGNNITYTLQIKNRSPFVGINYEDLRVSIHYCNAGSPADSAIDNFYQGHKKKAEKSGTVDGGWVTWKDVGAEVGSKGTAAFKVGVEGKYRFKAVVLWKSGRKPVELTQEVRVNGEGKMTPEDSIRLRSGASAVLARGYGVRATVVAAVVAGVLLFTF